MRPALRGGGSNYAFSGARAQDTASPYDLPEQVAAFLSDFSGSAPASALYAVEMGGNDLRDALVAGLSGGAPAAQAVVQAALEAVSDNLVQLYVAGARDFLIWSAPDIGLAPAINSNPPRKPRGCCCHNGQKRALRPATMAQSAVSCTPFTY